MKAEPLVSVLVTTYNHEAYLRQALDSILAQQCPFPFEVLIGEDCSTDGTRALCLEYAERYPEQVVLQLNETNKGLIDNYFDLVERARGRYLADCGGDDYWLTTDKLEKQVAILERLPEVGLTYGNWRMLDQKGGTFRPNRCQSSADRFEPRRMGSEAAIDYLNRRDFPAVVLSTALFRKDWLLDEIQQRPYLFRGEGIVCEDLPITLALLFKGPFHYLNEELMVYRVLERSVSHSTTLDENLKRFSLPTFRQTLALAKALALPTSRLQPFYDTILPDMVFHAFLHGDRAWMADIRQVVRSYGVRMAFRHRLMSLASRSDLGQALLLGLYRRFKRNDRTS